MMPCGTRKQPDNSVLENEIVINSSRKLEKLFVLKNLK